MGNQRYSFANALELTEVQFIIVVRIEQLESLYRGQVDNILLLSNGRLDDDCRWEKVGDIVDVVIGIVDVVGDLVDVLHGAPPEGQLHLPLRQETVPILVNGVESSLS